MASKYLIGLDIGTSGAKCILVDDKGAVLASSTQEYPLSTPRPGWAEQNPQDWWDAVVRGLKVILPKANVPKDQIAGVSFSGQMHGLVALDKDLNVIRPAILWCDSRTQKQCDWITEKAGGLSGLLTYTNNQMLAGYTGGKLIWFKEEEPELFAKMTRFICPKDYIRLKVCGELAIDASDASGTGFFNTRERVWADDLIALAGLDKAIFPDVLESTDLAGRVTRACAEETGLPEGLPVYAGGGDAVIQTTGAGLVKPGVVGVVIGTAGNVSMALDRYFDNPKGALQMFCNNAPGLWQAIGCTLSAGGSYRWYRDTLCEHLKEMAAQGKGNVYDLMGKEAEQSRPGANGVLFAPYMSGERCPYPDPNARGVFYGLSLSSTRGDITRAVMEGVTYSLRDCMEILRGMGLDIGEMYACGGGGSSPLWRQMLADAYNCPVTTVKSKEGPALGVAILAGVGAGLYPSVQEACDVMIQTNQPQNPIAENVPQYESFYQVYKSLYPALKENFKLLAKAE